MTSNSEQQTMQDDSSVPLATDTTTELRRYSYRELPSKWPSLEIEVQKAMWRSDPIVPPLINSLYWMWNKTKTRDDQDPIRPYKPFPVRDYLKALHAIWIKSPFLFV